MTLPGCSLPSHDPLPLFQGPQHLQNSRPLWLWAQELSTHRHMPLTFHFLSVYCGCVAQIQTSLFKATPSHFLGFVQSVNIREIVSLKDLLYSFLKTYL